MLITIKKIDRMPASYLDQKVFNRDNSFLKDAPYLSTLLQNPNHIGCHTLGHSESYFKGTQKLKLNLSIFVL